MSYDWGVSLPESVLAKIELAPPEDVILRVLRARHTDVTFLTSIPFDHLGNEVWPNGIEMFVLIRRVPGQFSYRFDDRFVDAAMISIQVFCKDPEAELKASLVSEAIRVSLRDEARNPTWYAGLGGLIRVTRNEEAVRKTDWATATGPVQFADLPTGYQRYESTFNCLIRKDTRPSTS